MTTFEENWFFTCVQLAQNEMLEFTPPPLDYDKIIEKAKVIYKKGFKKNIKQLTAPKEEKPVERPAAINPSKKEQKTLNNKSMKICPECDEEIPSGWAIHSYKKNGDKCGYKF